MVLDEAIAIGNDLGPLHLIAAAGAPTIAQVEDTAGMPIPGLFAAGELVGGLFYHNYPGGTGLTSGAVFGKLAGESAAASIATAKSRTAA